MSYVVATLLLCISKSTSILCRIVPPLWGPESVPLLSCGRQSSGRISVSANISNSTSPSFSCRAWRCRGHQTLWQQSHCRATSAIGRTKSLEIPEQHLTTYPDQNSYNTDQKDSCPDHSLDNVHVSCHISLVKSQVFLGNLKLLEHQGTNKKFNATLGKTKQYH